MHRQRELQFHEITFMVFIFHIVTCEILDEGCHPT